MVDSMVMNYLQTMGKQIGAEARAGDTLAIEIVKTYELYYRYPGPAELGILHELIRQHKITQQNTQSDNCKGEFREKEKSQRY